MFNLRESMFTLLEAVQKASLFINQDIYIHIYTIWEKPLSRVITTKQF